MSDELMLKFNLDPNFECEAPTYVDFQELAQKSNQYDDNADEWFDNLLDYPSSSQFESVSAIDSKLALNSPQICVDLEPKQEVSWLPAPIKKGGAALKKMFSSTNIATHIVNRSAGSIPKTKRDPAAKVATCSVHKDSPFSSVDSVSKEVGHGLFPNCLPEGLPESKRIRLEAKRGLAKTRQSSAKVCRPLQTITMGRSLIGTKEQSSSSKAEPEEVKPKDFANTLRSNDNPKQTSNKKHLTKVRPFTFECEKRAALRSADAAVSSSNSLQVPMAEFITNYQTSTPPRFRHAPSTPCPNRTGPHETGSEFGPGHLTMAKTPKLLTKGRKRPVLAKGAKEMEEEEILKMKQHQFKARPFNRDIINKDGLYGVPLKRTVELTHPMTPDLTNMREVKKRKTMCDEQETSHKDMDKQFHARPMPDFKEVKGVPAKRVAPPIEGVSPTLMKRRRQCNSSSTLGKEDRTKEPESCGFVKPMPNFDKRFEVKYAERQQVVPQPFSFEERERNKATPKPTAEEKFVFTARSKPDFSKMWQPCKHTSHTIPTPFTLQTDIRGDKHANKWKKEVEEKLQKEKKEAEFKANKNVSAVLYSKPFIPEKSRHPLTQVDNFVLHSELRSTQRMKYDSEKRQRCYLLDMENLQRRTLKEASKAKEIAEFRKTLVHKAQPIAHYASTIIKPSDRPCTQPFSPNFRRNKRNL